PRESSAGARCRRTPDPVPSRRDGRSCYGLPEEREAGGRDGRSGDPQGDASDAEPSDETDRDPGGMEAARRDDEADTVEKPVLPRRQFRAVGVAVENREEGDEGDRGRELRPRLPRDRQAEQDRGHSDADLDSGKRNASQPEQAAERHHQRKRDGQQPHRRRPELRAPDSDGDHRQDVIESRDGMAEPRKKSRRLPARDVRPRRGQSEHQQEQNEESPGATIAHRDPPRSMSVRWIVQYAASDPTA